MNYLPSVCCAAVLVLTAMAADAGSTIRFAGLPGELVISEVSEHTVRIELSPLDEQLNPHPAIPSTVLVPFPVKEKLRVRELVNDPKQSGHANHLPLPLKGRGPG